MRRKENDPYCVESSEQWQVDPCLPLPDLIEDWIRTLRDSVLLLV